MLAHVVAAKLQLQWSPQQIAGWLRRAYPDDENYHVSHETIYRIRPLGGAIYYAVVAAARLQPSSNARHATSCWSR
jgi:IS30 family transposase